MIKKYHRHIYLYAKGWYKKNKDSRLEDLKVIFSKISMLDLEDVSEEHICNVLTEIVYDNTGRDLLINALMEGLGIRSPWRQDETLGNVERYVRSMLSEIFRISVTLEEVGKPDPEMLPMIDGALERYEALTK